MGPTHQLLEHHILYGLDKVIVDYLTPILTRELGEPFRVYLARQTAQNDRQQADARTKGEFLVGLPVELQEDVLPRGFDPLVNLAWHTLLDAAGEKWRELCILYDAALSECGDLACMAVAQQTAEDSGDPDHARRVREIMGLADDLSPTWFPEE